MLTLCLYVLWLDPTGMLGKYVWRHVSTCYEWTLLSVRLALCLMVRLYVLRLDPSGMLGKLCV